MNERCSHSPALSICLPVYNAAPYLCECLESILSQDFDDFELIVVDDGSTDGSADVVASYKDPRIRLHRAPHDYIGTINLLLRLAQGKYLVRMDADDLMATGRLRFQYDYMERHPDVDILGGSLRYFGYRQGTNILAIDGYVTPRHLLPGCCVANSTTIMRRDRVLEAGLHYDAEYLYAEDYHFWVQAVIAGLRIVSVKEILTFYRVTPSQASTFHCIEQQEATKKVQRFLSRWLSRDEERWNEGRVLSIPRTGNLLTVIIPFLNEKEEVGRTVRSIRETVGDSVDIIAINDQSDDGYPYREDLAPYGVSYVYNPERKGVAASRDYGVSLCTTPYFLLLDAHMRFYDAQWARRLTDLLAADDRCILCCQTLFLKKTANGEVVKAAESPTTYGAFCPFNQNSHIPDLDWNYYEGRPDQPVEPIAAICGAGYAASKRYWERIKGLNGLRSYGSDEAYLSWKTWSEGGQCLLVKDVVIGHIYRQSSPYHRFSDEEIYNHLLIAYLFFPTSLYSRACAVALKKDYIFYAMAQRILQSRQEEIDRMRDYYRSIQQRPFSAVFALHRQVLQRIPCDKAYSVERLQDIADYLAGCTPVGYGLYEGRTAFLIWLCHYAQFTKEAQWDEKASTLWQEIKEATLDSQLPLNFKHGLWGVGWAIFYLYANGMLDRLPMEAIHYIDQQTVVGFNPTLCDDLSLATGLGGLFAYYAVRRKRDDLSKVWPAEFRHSLNEAAQRLLKTLDSERAACYFAMFFIACERQGYDKENPAPALHDWMEFPARLPADSKYWKPSLPEGCIGTGLLTLLILQNQHNHERH